MNTFTYNLALKSVGLFRLVGNKAEVEKYKAMFDSEEEFEFPDTIDPTVVSSLVLLYLEELPEPITTFRSFDKFLEILKSTQQVEKLKNDLKTLPVINLKILQFIIRYFVYQVRHTAENGANSKNLSLVFGKILFRHEKGLEKTEHHDKVMSLTQLLIDNYYEVFGVEKPTEESQKPVEKKEDVPVQQTQEKPVEEKQPDTGRKMVSDDLTSHFQIVIDQWKDKYQKEVLDRKKEKEYLMLDIQNLQKQVDDLKEELRRTEFNDQGIMVGNEKSWIKKEKEYLEEIERRDKEFQEYKEKMDLEIIELKRKLLLEKKKDDVVIDPSLKRGDSFSRFSTQPKPQVEEPKIEKPKQEVIPKEDEKKCFKCNKGIKDDEFMESGQYLYHDDCFTCSKCGEIIDGPFKNTEGILTCKPCTEPKKEVPKVTQPEVKPQPSSGKPCCGACGEEILPGRVKLKAIDKLYHSECFKCQKCHNDFVDKKFFNLDGVPVCKDCKTKK